MKAKNFSYRLSIYFIISAIILSGIIILIGDYYFRDLMLDRTRFRLQYELREVLDDLENSMDNPARFVKQLALDLNQPEFSKDPSKFMSLIFDGQAGTYAIRLIWPEIRTNLYRKSDFSLCRLNGVVRPVNTMPGSNNEKINEWINKMVLQSKPEWSVPFYNSEINARSIIYAYPFDYLENKLKVHAIFFCSVNIDNDLRNLNNQTLVKSGVAVLLDKNNQIIYHPDIMKTGNSTDSLIRIFDKSNLDINSLLANRPSGYQQIHSQSMHCDNSIVIYWPIKSSSWYMIVTIPENLFISENKRILLFIIPLILFVGSIAASVTIYNSIKLYSPISVLADDSSKIVAEADFGNDFNSSDTKVLSNSALIWRLSEKRSLSPKNDINALVYNLEKIKDRLTEYRESSIQSSLDRLEIEKELNLARDIEMGMVPINFPLFPGRTDFDCFGRLIPAKIVGGDLFDLFLLDDKHLFISITDTVGKGIPAAMYSVMTRTFIRSIANPITRLGKIMESLNDALTLVHNSDMFATVFLGKLDLETGEMEYCNAGHPYPLILRNSEKDEVLNNSQGIPVGIKRNISYSENRINLASGESIILFTDGVTEQNNESGTLFGLDGLIATLSSLRDSPSQKIVNEILDALTRFQGLADVHDDIALVAVTFLG